MRLSIFSLLILSLALSSCKTTKDIKDGRTAFESKQFVIASELLEKEYNATKDDATKAELSYLIGESYRNNNETDASLKWYDEAVKLGYGPKALYEMGYGLKKLERYGLAARYFEELLQSSDRASEIQQEIRKCREAERLKRLGAKANFELELLSFNSASSEYSPFLLSQNELIYTNDVADSGTDFYKWTGRGFSDLYVYDLNTGTQREFSDEINTPQNEGSATFTKDRNKLYFSRCYDEEGDHYCKILMSEKVNDNWNEPIPVFPMDPTLNYRDPVLIEGDSVLIFSSDDQKGYGGTDLYYSVYEENEWTAPDLMPPSINTLGNERFPTADGDTLYFSSDFLLGLGGLDIFKTYLKADNSWSAPENVGMPFNSSYDDFGLIISQYPRDFIAIEGFFTSDRIGKGKDDIYRFIQRSDQKIEDIVELPDSIVTEEEKEVLTALSILVLETNYAVADDPNSLALGKKPVTNATIIYDRDGNKENLNTDEKGRALIEVEQGTFYDFLIGKKDYLNTKIDFSFNEEDITVDEGLQTFRLEVDLDRIFPDVEITLDNIYYDFDQSIIRADAKPSLNELYAIMVNNPELKIQLSSHTDCQGDFEYNEGLSQRRAQAAIEYIISQGVGPSRIVAVGYGESRLAIECICEECSEEEHQLNRRTTFKVLN